MYFLLVTSGRLTFENWGLKYKYNFCCFEGEKYRFKLTVNYFNISLESIRTRVRWASRRSKSTGRSTNSSEICRSKVCRRRLCHRRQDIRHRRCRSRTSNRASSTIIVIRRRRLERRYQRNDIQRRKRQRRQIEIRFLHEEPFAKEH